MTTEMERTIAERIGVPAPRWAGSGRIVLAEDDDAMRSMVARALRRDGYEVVEAANGTELLDTLEHASRLNDPVDLVITDVRMPGISGLQALDWLHTVRGLRTPVLVVTAFGDPRTHLQARQLGARVLDKPFDLEDLRAIVEEMSRPGMQ